MRLLTVLVVLVVITVARTHEGHEYYQYRGPPAPLTSDGMVIDTPEVAHARAAHLAMHAQTMARLRKAQNDYEMYENNEMLGMPEMMGGPMVQNRQRSYASVERDGRVMVTPGMTEANPARLGPRGRAASKPSGYYDLDIFDGRRNFVYLPPVRVAYKLTPSVGYRGPLAPLGPDGRVVDTPEVMRAREAHMKAHARAVALSTHNDLYY